jgi:hypothetical protein
VQIELLFERTGLSELTATEITDMLLDMFTRTDKDFLPRRLVAKPGRPQQPTAPQLHDYRDQNETEIEIEPSLILHQKNKMLYKMQRVEYCRSTNHALCLPLRGKELLVYDRQCNLVSTIHPKEAYLAASWIYDFALDSPRVTMILANNILVSLEKGQTRVS